MSRTTKAHPASKLEDRVVAEETTTLSEGAVISVYRIRVGKLGHQSTRLVALHSMNRVEMTVDNISPQNLRVYLQLMLREIQRERAKLTAKPGEPFSRPESIHDFVTHMAFRDMFIFEALGELHELTPEQIKEVDQANTKKRKRKPKQGSDADKPKPIKKMVERRRKIQKQPQVLPGSDAVM